MYLYAEKARTGIKTRIIILFPDAYDLWKFLAEGYKGKKVLSFNKLTFEHFMKYGHAIFKIEFDGAPAKKMRIKTICKEFTDMGLDADE